MQAREVDILTSLDAHAAINPHGLAHTWREHDLTWGEFAARSLRLAGWLDAHVEPGAPVVVFGHKHPDLLVCFVAAMRSGRAYIPLDSSLPAQRVTSILEAAAATHILAPEDASLLPHTGAVVLAGDDLRVLMDQDSTAPRALTPVEPSAAQYTIFTSGSTGTPKGVQISRDSVNRFASWITSVAARYVEPDAGITVINQAPFSFDLSVMDVMYSWATGARLFSVDRDHIVRLRDLFEALRSSQATVWVSTPSFADLCLADPDFSSSLMPDVRLFLFCGETLQRATAVALRERFPLASVINTYGPTESTVAVTEVDVDDAVLAAFPVLPVGAPKPGTTLLILDPDGSPVPDGDKGEIVIAGDTVSLGYYRRPDLTDKAFGQVDVAGVPTWAYWTGDAGVLSEGQLHFHGRLDFQVKLHGYRIEIEDIEAQLRALPAVQQAVVVPRYDPTTPTTVTSLHAVVHLSEPPTGSTLATTVQLKRELRALIPDYMVPKTMSFVSEIPMTANGKADRAAVAATLA